MDFREGITPLIELALREDLGLAGDRTSLSTIPADRVISGKITAKAPGVVAGLEAVALVYEALDPTVIVRPLLDDGQFVTTGIVVCEVTGTALSVLSGERTALNFLQRLSGVATMARRFVDAVQHTKAVILDTRKTTPGWRIIEKYAVRQGGAQNHRIGLYDMVLIKDNHIDAAGSITAAVSAARQALRSNQILIEVEVKDLEELHEAIELHVDRILLDNMSLAEMRQAVALTNKRIPLEASGNVSLETVAAIAETGVDFISVGALTHSAPILDLSMRLIQQPVAMRSL